MNEPIQFIYSNIQSLNNSRFFAGIIMLMLNIGSKYVSIGLSKTQEQYIRKSFARQLLIFAICWMGTRDIITSIILTASFVVLSDYLLNEESSLCVLPDSWKALEEVLDTDDDKQVSEQEIQEAIQILEKAKEKKRRQEQLRMVNTFRK